MKRMRDCSKCTLYPLHTCVFPAGTDFNNISHQWSGNRFWIKVKAAPKMLTVLSNL